MIFVEFFMLLPERAMIGAVFCVTVEAFLMRTCVLFGQIFVIGSVLRVIAGVVVVVVIVRERGGERRAQGQGRSRQDSLMHGRLLELSFNHAAREPSLQMAVPRRFTCRSDFVVLMLGAFG
jgi:hypothetical protein